MNLNVFRIAWGAILAIGRWGRTGVLAMAGPVRRVLSVGFITTASPAIWKCLTTVGSAAATVMSLYYILKGELVTTAEAIRIAKEQGLDERMTGRNAQEVLDRFVESIPGVNEDAKEIFRKAAKEGIAAAQKEADRRASAAAPVQTTPKPVVIDAKRNVDSMIESRIANLPADSRPRVQGTADVSTMQAAMARIDAYNRFARAFADRYNIGTADQFFRDLQELASFADVIGSLRK